MYYLEDYYFQEGFQEGFQESYEIGFEAGYKLALCESIFNEKGYAKYVAKCKAKGKKPLPFNKWKKSNIAKTIGASALIAGAGIATGVGVNNHLNYKAGKEYYQKSKDGDNFATMSFRDNDKKYKINKDLNKRDIRERGREYRYENKIYKKLNKETDELNRLILSNKILKSRERFDRYIDKADGWKGKKEFVREAKKRRDQEDLFDY